MKPATHSPEETVRRVKDAGRVLRDTLDLKGRLERNPYGTIAAALGIGFVLGGGLFTGLTARILGAGLRIGMMMALPILQKKLVQTFNESELDNNKGETQ